MCPGAQAGPVLTGRHSPFLKRLRVPERADDPVVSVQGAGRRAALAARYRHAFCDARCTLRLRQHEPDCGGGNGGTLRGG